MRDAAPADVPVTVKLRIGWDADTLTGPGSGQALRGRGRRAADGARTHPCRRCTIPAFTRRRSRRSRRLWSIPVLANGDVTGRGKRAGAAARPRGATAWPWGAEPWETHGCSGRSPRQWSAGRFPHRPACTSALPCAAPAYLRYVRGQGRIYRHAAGAHARRLVYAWAARRGNAAAGMLRHAAFYGPGPCDRARVGASAGNALKTALSRAAAPRRKARPASSHSRAAYAA